MRVVTVFLLYYFSIAKYGKGNNIIINLLC